MTNLKFLSLLLSIGLSMAALIALRDLVQENKSNPPAISVDGKGFAVLELFTSEGCSSCPPADELLAKIQKEYVDEPVYLLAFHVDYWDRLGWKDIFSNPDFSNRQSEYERWLGSGSVYTPQLVVNGHSDFVGSDEFKIRKAVTAALVTDPKTGLAIQTRRDDHKLTLQYQVDNSSKKSRLLIATIQKSATSKIERGENKGRLLSHAQIVRELKSETLTKDGKGSTYITLHGGFDPADWEVIVMVQDVKDGGILAAARIKL